jgi:hypothetical protein
LKVFPDDLEKKPEYIDFVNNKYPKLNQLMDKGPIKIMQTPKSQRTERDVEKMIQFFT